jgi:hypothetical protein
MAIWAFLERERETKKKKAVASGQWPPWSLNPGERLIDDDEIFFAL